MENLILEQSQAEIKQSGRLTLDQFKSQNVSSEKNNEELEKLTGGILGACHAKKNWFERAVDYIKECSDAYHKIHNPM